MGTFVGWIAVGERIIREPIGGPIGVTEIDMAVIFDQTPEGMDARGVLARAMLEPMRVSMLPQWQALRGTVMPTPEISVPADKAMRQADAKQKSMAKAMTAAQDAEVTRMMASFGKDL